MTVNPIKTGNQAVGRFEPYMTPSGPEGEVSWIRESGEDGVDVRVGIWRCLENEFPDPFPVTFAGAETLYVLEGTLSLKDLERGGTTTHTVGDIVSVERGTRTEWSLSPTFSALMFIAGGGGTE